MGKVRFHPRVVYVNKIPLNAGRYKIKVPAGLPAGAVRAPILKSAEEMGTLDDDKKTQTGKVTAGLTTAKLKVHFSNIKQQWKQISSTPGLRQWVFQGGDILLEVSIWVYMLDGWQKYGEMLSAIMEHELLHVYDEIKIVTKDLPAALPKETLIKKYLINGQVCDDGTYANWFTDKGLKTGSGLQNCCESTWADFHNAAIKKRDSGSDWESYRKKIDGLMRRLK